MKYVEVGGARMSAIGLGTWQFGSPGVGLRRPTTPSATRRAIVTGPSIVGITLFDTAEVYGFGRSERILGQGARGPARRGLHRLQDPPGPAPRAGRAAAGPGQPPAARDRRASTSTSSISRTRWCRCRRPCPPSRSSLDEGMIGHAGVSNYSLARWQAAEEALGRPVLSNQVRYNLVDRRPEKDLLPWAQAHDRLIIAYSPLAQGLLSGRYDADNRPAGAVRIELAGLPPREPPPGRTVDRGAAQVAARPRGHAVAGGAGLADPSAQRRGHPRGQFGGPGGGERGGGRPGADRRRGRRARRGLGRLPSREGFEEVWPELARERLAGLAERLQAALGPDGSAVVRYFTEDEARACSAPAATAARRCCNGRPI